ncbi:hypothetical protein D3C80_1813830 [compost metagenome]
MLELEHFHAGETQPWRHQCGAEGNGPVDLHHARQDRRAREVAGEAGQVRRHPQAQQSALFQPLKHLWIIRPWRFEQGLDLRLG